MSWMKRLYETYDACAGNESIPDIEELCPVGYSVQNAHIEVVIDQDGNFKRASLVQKENNPKTLIPVTESSAKIRIPFAIRFNIALVIIISMEIENLILKVMLKIWKHGKNQDFLMKRSKPFISMFQRKL
jgi:hypothetical protein